MTNNFLYPTMEELMTPERFLNLTEEEKANISSVKIVVPDVVNKRAGNVFKRRKKGFGGFLIQYKFPVYKLTNGTKRKSSL